MKISEIRIYPTSGNTKLKASAAITLVFDGGSIQIRDFRVLESSHGQYWVANPADSYEKNGQRKYKEIVIPSDTFKSELYSEILNEFKQTVKN